MTKKDNLPNGDLAPLGDKLREAWHRPSGDETRAGMVNALLDLSVQDRAFVVCWALLGKPDARPPAGPDSIVREQRAAYVAALSERPELFLSLDPPFFSHCHFAAYARPLFTSPVVGRMEAATHGRTWPHTRECETRAAAPYKAPPPTGRKPRQRSCKR